jgi:arsenate reductase
MKILFMCVANSARSQLAEGLVRHLLGPQVEIQSAGSQPTHVNPYAVKVMTEIGVDVSKHSSKSVNDLSTAFTQDLNYVITLCAEEVCPVLFSKNAKRLHWPFQDPASKEVLPDEEMTVRFRKARDLIATAILKFKAEQGL